MSQTNQAKQQPEQLNKQPNNFKLSFDNSWVDSIVFNWKLARKHRSSRRAAKKLLSAGNQSEAQAAFLNFWDGTYPQALAYASFRLPNRETAEDVLHEAYLSIWQRLLKANEADQNFIVSQPRAYLYQTLRRGIADYYRLNSDDNMTVSLDLLISGFDFQEELQFEARYMSGSQNQAVSNLNSNLNSALSTAENLTDKIDDKLNRQLLNKAFRTLTPEQKEILLLRYQQELEFNEIATISGESVSTVKSRLYRAKEALASAVLSTKTGTTNKTEAK